MSRRIQFSDEEVAALANWLDAVRATDPAAFTELESAHRKIHPLIAKRVPDPRIPAERAEANPSRVVEPKAEQSAINPKTNSQPEDS